MMRGRYWEAEEERKATERRDREEAEEYRRSRLPSLRPICSSCGYRHRGATSQREELRTLWCRKAGI